MGISGVADVACSVADVLRTLRNIAGVHARSASGFADALPGLGKDEESANSEDSFAQENILRVGFLEPSLSFAENLRAYQREGRYDIVVVGEGSLEFVNGLLREICTGEKPEEVSLRGLRVIALETEKERERELQLQQAAAFAAY